MICSIIWPLIISRGRTGKRRRETVGDEEKEEHEDLKDVENEEEERRRKLRMREAVED